MTAKPTTAKAKKNAKSSPPSSRPRLKADRQQPATRANKAALDEKRVKAGVASKPAPYWLFKSEPDVFSFEMLKAKGEAGEQWDGVRNYLARNNMRAMQLGQRAFFYHSNIGLEIVGICEVSRLAHPDSTTDDPRWECVDVRAVCDMPKPVSLSAVKANPKLANMSLVTSMRLSVQPVSAQEWKEICRMGALDPGKLEKR